MFPTLNNPNPKVSIILPTFNGQQFIWQAIESCLNQTYTNIELIIVNDASTDKTQNIIDKYASLDPRIRVVTNKVNRKLPASLNIGHRVSVGEFITWTSDDNLYHEDAIAKMLHFLQQNIGIMMTYCDYTIIDSCGNQIKKVVVPSYENLSEYNCIGACFLYHRIVYQKIGSFFNRVRLAEDYDYWLRVASNFRMMPIHNDLYFYRTHENSLTSQEKNTLISLAKEISLMRNLSGLKWLSKLEKGEKAIYFTQKAYNRRNYHRSAMYLFTAFRQSPALAMDWLRTTILRKFVA